MGDYIARYRTSNWVRDQSDGEYVEAGYKDYRFKAENDVSALLIAAAHKEEFAGRIEDVELDSLVEVIVRTVELPRRAKAA